MGAHVLESNLSMIGEAMGPLLVLAIVLVVGSGGGWLARRVGIPGVTGTIVAGALLGVTLFKGMNVPATLQPISTFAISLIAVSAGGHLSYRRIHNSLRRILWIGVLEALLAVVFVFGAIFAVTNDWKLSMLLGSLAAATAPGTTFALIRENRAKGPFVKTLLASVAVDSSVCILLFAFVHNVVAHSGEQGQMGSGLIAGAWQIGWQLLGSAGLAIALGFGATRISERRWFHDFGTMAVAILLAAGLAILLDFSPLLTCLIFGMYLGNSSSESERLLTVLEPVETLLYTCFFAMAGASIHFGLLAAAGPLCALYLVMRVLGKSVGSVLGAVISRSSRRIMTSIPFGLVPQAGVALGLVVILQGDPRIDPEFSSLVGTLVLAAVMVNEIIGPFATRYALRRAGEAGLDRPRLVEFLQEEFILTDFHADDKWDALEKLTDFYAKVHRISAEQRDVVFRSLVEREREFSTAIGSEAAIPHGKVPTGSSIQGVMAICSEGIDFDAPDGLPVKLIVLIVTPHDHEQRHLEVLASLSSMISHEQVRARLIVALDANDAWEVLESEESRSYNFFLEEEDTLSNA
ncbi:MAG: PTS sugar transporter subunit IIA [Candidatus Hydrogenedentes bacterium]|nr:PTS sugar transporter subunit IIA [Candidatus Hydrogenedentota bacterium]